MNNTFNIRLEEVCNQKNNRLCIGLDINPEKYSNSVSSSLEFIESFAKDIIDSTIKYCPVYKPNLAFYERFGHQGFKVIEKIVEHINGRAITIADGKRGDIGNTTEQYAIAIFEKMGFDAITVSPYMGRDSILPFIKNKEKGAFILCLTSNQSANDFQFIEQNGKKVYEKVAEVGMELNNNNNIGLVVGATKPEHMTNLLTSSKGLSWLIPGVGAQGGNLKNSLSICKSAEKIGIINISRGIICAGKGEIKDIVSATINYTNEIRKFL